MNNICNPKGKVYVVATPIGNLSDISARAITTLENSSYVFCEDTRHSAPMLSQLGISKKELLSLHQHNQAERIEKAISVLDTGKNIALISDAGTPAISDPGAYFINQIREIGFEVIPIAGACAAICAFSVSGIVSDGFRFIGFLPSKKKELDNAINKIANSDLPTIIYEAPHRLFKTLTNLLKFFPDNHQVFFSREISKIYEEYKNITLGELAHRLSDINTKTNKGEWVLIINPLNNSKSQDDELQDWELAKKIEQAFESLVSPSKLAKAIHKVTNIDREKVYNNLLNGKN